MADLKISALPASTAPLAGTEVLPIVQSGATKKVSIANVTAGRNVSAAGLELTTTPLAVASGGTGLNTIATGYIPYGNGTGALSSSVNFNYDGTSLTVYGGGTNAKLNTYAAGQKYIDFQWYGASIGAIKQTSGTFISIDSPILAFETGSVERMRIAAGGDVTVSTGNLVIGTAGKGIDFSADGQAAGMTSELLDDYEEGTWTPVLSFQTAGDLDVAYLGQVGSYTKIGNRVILQGFITTSSFTYTTASGYLKVDGIPFNGSSVAGRQNYGALNFGGITKVGYTDFVTSIEPNINFVLVYCSGSAVSPTFISAADMPSGGAVNIKFTMTYEV